MGTFRIKRGRNISITGEAKKEIVKLPLPKRIAVQPLDYKGLNSRLSVKVDDHVKVGSPILSDKINPKCKVLSPASGKVIAVNRGQKRALLEIVIETDGKQEVEVLDSISKTDVGRLTRDKIIDHLLEGGLWPVIRQRPFSKIAQPEDFPKAIFIHAMNTEPLALDIDFVLKEEKEHFQVGLDIIAKLTKGKVHLCILEDAQSETLNKAQHVEIHRFSGPHPAGNVSTHIHYVDPINKGDIVWYLEAQDVVRIAELMLKGVYPAKRYVAITGEGVKNRVYAETLIGTPLSALLQGSDLNGMRCISGSILSGKNIGKDGYLCFYDSQVTVIPEGGKRELLGWLSPGFNKYTFSKTFASSFLPDKEISLDTDKNGSDRAIVLNHIYDAFVPLDIMVYFLLRAVISGDIDEAEKLGILECDEEDFALCTFACPSKTNVGQMIRSGLETIEKEG